jgi:hypothetical protein
MLVHESYLKNIIPEKLVPYSNARIQCRIEWFRPWIINSTPAGCTQPGFISCNMVMEKLYMMSENTFCKCRLGSYAVIIVRAMILNFRDYYLERVCSGVCICGLLYTVLSFVNLKATVTSRLPAGTAIKKSKLILLFLWNDTWLVSGKRCSAWRWVMQFLPGSGKWQLPSTLSVNAVFYNRLKMIKKQSTEEDI